MADIVLINKINNAEPPGIMKVKESVKLAVPDAKIIEAKSVVSVDDKSLIKDKNVLVVEDGPTLTHGGMSFGAGIVAAEMFGAKSVIDPRPYAKGSIKNTFSKYSHLSSVLPAMGYGDKQVKELEDTINSVPCDTVVIGTPIDLRKIVKLSKPAVRVSYELEVVTNPGLDSIVKSFVKEKVNPSG